MKLFPFRDFLKRFSLFNNWQKILPLLIFVFTFGVGAFRVRALELTLAHFVATNHPMHTDVFVPLAARVAADSGGQLTIRIIPGLTDPSRMFQRVTNHEADMVFGLPGYTPDQFLRTRLIELPGIADLATNATQMVNNALPRTIAPDFAAVVPLGVWVNEPAVLLSREKAIRTLSDIAGLKVRVADPISARVVTLWGATPVTLSANQIFQAMNTAQVDAALIGSSGITAFQLYNVSTNCTIGLPNLFTSFYLLMNRDAWNNLSPSLQLILQNATGPAFSQGATVAYVNAGQAGLQKLRDTNIEIIELTSATAAPFAAVGPQVIAETLNDLTSHGINGQQVLDTFRPRLTATRNSNQFQILLHGAEGLNYELLTSLELGTTWTSLETKSGDIAGEALWNLPIHTNSSHFFRVEVH